MSLSDSNRLVALMRQYLFCAVCSVLSIVLLAAIWILWQDVHTREALNREASQEGQAMLSTLASGPVIRTELARAQDIVQRIESNLVVESKMQDNLGYFYKLQSDSHVEITTLRQQPSDPNSDGEYCVIPFTLQVSGSYEQVANFLLGIETGPKFAQIRFFSFRRRDIGSDNIALSIDLKLLAKR